MSALFASYASAESRGHPIVVNVERAPESRGCPDAPGIFEAARRLFPTVRLDDAPSPGEATIGVLIRVHPAPEGHEANIWVSGARTGERHIEDQDSECRGLAAAIALALVLIVDPDAAGATRPPLAENATLATRAHASASTTKAREAHDDPLLALDAGGLGGLGQLGNPAFGAFLGAVIGFRHGPGLRVRGARLIALRTTVDPGTIEVDLWAGLLGPCWRFARADAWSLYPCLDFGIGRQYAAARDLRHPGTNVTRPYYSLGPSLTGALPLALGLELTAFLGVSANLWREDYLIDSVRRQGQARVSAFLGLGLGTTFEFAARGPEVIRR